jgi:hypothetical protein
MQYLWKDIIDENNLNFNGLNIDEKRELYHNQPALKLKDAIMKGNKSSIIDSVFFELEEFQCTEEEYVKRGQGNAIVTFAVLKDGKWYERGKMGWWGCIADEKNKDDWNNEFNKLIDTVPGETLLTIFDCHI